jgi:hypothetical protein
MVWLWLFALGLVGYRSGMFPRWLSFLLMLRGGGLRSLAGGVCVRGGFGRWDACGASDGPHVETGSGIAALAPWHVLLLAAWVLDRDPRRVATSPWSPTPLAVRLMPATQI